MRWTDTLRSDPLPWLLEPKNPSARYMTLTDLLDALDDDPEVRAAQDAILSHAPVAELLAAQRRDGSWVKHDYYLPKHRGTFWVLSVLADLGLTGENEQVRKSCEFMFTFQREHGPFCRRRRVSGRGIIWDDQPAPCTHARIVRFLIQLGYAGDSRLRVSMDWLLGIQRDDGMWHCRMNRGYGCLRATIDVLRVAALEPELAAQPAIGRAATVVCHLLMEPRMSRFHVKNPWTTLEYPYFDYSLISALDALARLGHTREQPGIASAMEYLLSRQLPDGTWPLDQSPYNPPFNPGGRGEPNKWLTLDALRLVRLFSEGMQGRVKDENARLF